MQEFKKGSITETKLGYILADTEHKYRTKLRSLREHVAKGEINQAEFERLDEKAESEWLGN